MSQPDEEETAYADYCEWRENGGKIGGRRAILIFDPGEEAKLAAQYREDHPQP